MTRMRFAKITGEGLTSIAVLVTLLWGCLLMERAITRDSRREAGRLLVQMKKMRRGRVVPASRPAGFPGSSRPVVG